MLGRLRRCRRAIRYIQDQKWEAERRIKTAPLPESAVLVPLESEIVMSLCDWRKAMGNPQHYGIELPGRCLQLIDGLWEHASQIFGTDRPDLGPLTSTFLISMSMPIVNLPIERIERQIDRPNDDIYADDRPFSGEAVSAFEAVVRRGTLQNAPFFVPGAWSYVQLRDQPFGNIAEGLCENVAESLGDEKAKVAAAIMPTQQWMSILRNSLAHGGVAYLDENGQSSYDKPARKYAFVGGKYARPACIHGDGACPAGMGNLERLNILRISVADYRVFLTRWVGWLSENRIIRPMNA